MHLRHRPAHHHHGQRCRVLYGRKQRHGLHHRHCRHAGVHPASQGIRCQLLHRKSCLSLRLRRLLRHAGRGGGHDRLQHLQLPRPGGSLRRCHRHVGHQSPDGGGALRQVPGSGAGHGHQYRGQGQDRSGPEGGQVHSRQLGPGSGRQPHHRPRCSQQGCPDTPGRRQRLRPGPDYRRDLLLPLRWQQQPPNPPDVRGSQGALRCGVLHGRHRHRQIRGSGNLQSPDRRHV